MSVLKSLGALAASFFVMSAAEAQTFWTAGSEFLVNTTVADSQSIPSATGLSDGSFVVVWQDFSSTGGDTSFSAIRGQRFNASGVAQGGEFLVNTTTASNQTSPSIASLSGGGFVVAWQDLSQTGGDASGWAIRAQRYNTSGVAQGGEFLVNTTTIDNQNSPRVTGLSGGGFVVVWRDTSQTGGDTSSNAIRAQRFNASGVAQGGEFLVNTTTTNTQDTPATASLTGGGFVIAWRDASLTGGDTSSGAIRAQRFNASGVAQGGEFLVNSTTDNMQDLASVAGLTGGGFVIAWVDASQTGGDTSGNAIRAQRYDASGVAQGGEFLVNTTTASDQTAPSVAGLSNDGFIVAWRDSSSTGADTSGRAVRAQGYNASGVAQNAEFLVNTTTLNDQDNASVAALSEGALVIAWDDISRTGGDAFSSAVRAQRYMYLELNERVIDAFVTAASDFGAAGTQLLSEEIDYDAASASGDLQLAVVVQNPDQFVTIPGQADLTIELEGAVFDGHVQGSAFSSGGVCDFALTFDGRSGGDTVTFRTGNLSQCDDRLVNRVYSAGADDDDMVFTLPLTLTGGDVNASVQITNTVTGITIGSDTQDNDDANTQDDPIARAVDGFVVRSFGTAARTSEVPLGTGQVSATLASEYNDLDSLLLGTLEATVQGQVFVGGTATTSALASQADQVDLTVTLENAAGIEALELVRGASSLRAPIVDNQAHFVLTGASSLTLSDLAGGAVNIQATPDADFDTLIVPGSLTTRAALSFLNTLALNAETLEGGINQIRREGTTSTTFEWVGDSAMPTRNVFRIVGLGETLPTLSVTLTHSSAGLDGTYPLQAGTLFENGELLLTGADIETAVGGPFGRADVSFFVEANNVRFRRFLLGLNDTLTDMGDDNN